MNRKTRNLLRGANIWYLGEGMLGPLFAVFSEQIGGDVLNISYAWAAYLFASGILTIIVGWAADRFKYEKQLMVLGYILNAAFTFSYLLVNNQRDLLLVQVGLGASGALATPTWQKLYSKHENRKKAGYTWGLADGDAKIITGFAIIIGGLLVTQLSFTSLFIVMGCIQTIAAIYQARILTMR